MVRDDGERGVLYGLAAYGIWGIFPLYFRLLDDASPMEVLGHRIVWSFLLLGVVLAARRQWRLVGQLRGDPKTFGLAALGGVLIAVNWGVYIWAVNNDHVVEAALGYFVNPLVTVAAGVVVLNERLRRAQMVALAIGAVAVVVLTVAYGQVPVISLVLACTFGSYSLVKKLVPLDAMSSLTVEAAVLTPVALVGLGVIASRGDLAFGSEGVGLSFLLVSAGLVTVVPLVLFGAAARLVPLSMLGLMQYLTPTLQFLCGVVVFRESVSAARWAGFSLVWLALCVLTWDMVRFTRERSPAVTTGVVPAVSGGD